MGFSNSDYSFYILYIFIIFTFLIPIELIYFIRGLITISYSFFCPKKLLTTMKKRNTLSKNNHRGCKEVIFLSQFHYFHWKDIPAVYPKVYDYHVTLHN